MNQRVTDVGYMFLRKSLIYTIYVSFLVSAG